MWVPDRAETPSSPLVRGNHPALQASGAGALWLPQCIWPWEGGSGGGEGGAGLTQPLARRTLCSLGSLARLSGRQNQHLPEWSRRRGHRAQGFPPAHLPTPPAAGQREEAQAAPLCRAPNTGPGEASFVFSLLSVRVPAGRWGREGLGPERMLREHGVGCRQESWHRCQAVALAAG